MLKKESILQEAQRLVYGDRAASHGSFEAIFKNAASLFSEWTGIEVGAMNVAQMMICLKQARFKHNSNHRDNLVDLAGYTELLSRIKEVDNGQTKRTVDRDCTERYSHPQTEQKGSELCFTSNQIDQAKRDYAERRHNGCGDVLPS